MSASFALVLLSQFGLFSIVCSQDEFGQPYIWPLPADYTVSDALSVSVSNSFQIQTTSTNAVIQHAIQRYTAIIFPHTAETEPPFNTSIVHNLTISIKNDSGSIPFYGMDESYQLMFPGTGIIANTIWGALRGLETLSQIVVYNFTARYYQSYAVNISDSPRFAWRGVMIDTSRHFLSISTIQTVLDSMSYAKFNTLHWHIIDAPSFPLESMSAPKLWNGAFYPQQRYSQSDVKSVIAYAAQRGIRIVVELDNPGHSLSWCTGYPSICPNATCNAQTNGMLNPANDLTYQILSDLLEEASDVFVDGYMHIGGDETSTQCWDHTPEIQQWEMENGFDDATALLYMIQYAQNAVHAAGKKPINWVDVFEKFKYEMDPSWSVIQVWKEQSTLAEVVQMGFEAILSSNVAWYLNYVDEIEGYNSWQTMYNVEPYDGIIAPRERELVLGGEACLWGEYVDNSNVESSMWPRAAAVAERLWSRIDVKSTKAAEPRYAYFRCLLNERGIAAEPYNYSQPHQAPPGPGSCYEQRRRT